MNAHEKGLHAAYEHLEGYPDLERVETIILAYLEASGMVMVTRGDAEMALAVMEVAYITENRTDLAPHMEALRCCLSPFSQANTEGEGAQ